MRTTGLWSLARDGYPIQYEYKPRAMNYSRKYPSETGDRGGRTWKFQGYWRTWKFQGSIKKEVEFPQECSWKTHVEWLAGNKKNVWLFDLVYMIHLPAPKIVFKFPQVCGAEELTYLNSSHKFIQCNSLLKCTCDIG